MIKKKLIVSYSASDKAENYRGIIVLVSIFH